jgi:AmpE protein
MKFIALILALIFIQYWGSAQLLHRDEWFQSLRARLAGSGVSSSIELAIAVLVPALLLFWLLDQTGSWLFGLPGLAISVLVLLYSFGRGDYEEAMSGYRRHCQEGDFEGAFLMTRQLFPCQHCDVEAEDAEHLHRWMKRRLLYMGFERWFAVIFYFALFGAAGALLYRLAQLAGEADENDSLQGQLLHVLDWLPTRLLVFSYTLTGDYMGSREQMMSSLRDIETSSDEVIADSAHAALGLKSTVFTDNGDVEAFAQVSDWEMGQLHSLMSRSAVAWVVVISLIVVFA